MEQQLRRARAELAEYQAMLDELPAIYETKFRHQLQGLAQDIRRLMDERRALQEQLSTTLPPGQALPALPPATPQGLVAVEAPPSRRPRSLRWRRWRRRWQGVSTAIGRLPERVAFPRLPASRRLPLLAVGTVLGVALLVVLADLGLRRLQPPTVQPRPAPTAKAPAPAPTPPLRADQDLRLRAQGEAWVEVEDLAGETVYRIILQAGDEQRIRLRDGLKLRSGRPDLVEVSVGDGPFEALNSINNLDWKTFRPTLLTPSGAPEVAPG